MCATNLTEVFEEVFGRRYRHEAVSEFLRQLRAAGSYEARFNGDSETSIVRKLNALHASLPASSTLAQQGRGLLPLGTVLAGCEVGTNCLGSPSSAHIGVIGHVTKRPGPRAGTTTVVYWAWHNNWLRNLSAAQRARDLGGGLGKLNDYALPTNWPTLGYERRWMGTPWLEVVHGPLGEALSVRRVLPELDDLDLGNAGYETWLVVPAEIRSELAAGRGVEILGAPILSARAGTAAIKMPSVLKRQPVDSSTLPASEKCTLSDPATVLAYTHRSEVVDGHVRVRLAFADVACPAFNGEAYLFAEHWALADR
jgi:hypothetical protein